MGTAIYSSPAPAASASNRLPFFGRAWRVKVNTSDGQELILSSSDFAEPLRCTFMIDTFMLVVYWQMELTIYNMASETAQQIWQGNQTSQVGSVWQVQKTLLLGDKVTVSAGYQPSDGGQFNPDANQLYSGKVLQPVWRRENVVDYKLILRCVTGLLEDNVNFVSIPIAKGVSQFETLQRICAAAKPKIVLQPMDAKTQAILENAKYSRAQVIHGRPWACIVDIMTQNSLFSFCSPDGLTVLSPAGIGEHGTQTPDLVYGSPDQEGAATTGAQQGTVKRTIIGVPQQTQQGVVFKVLLDPQVKIGSMIQLAPGTLVAPVAVQIGQLPPIPAPGGVYAVAGLRHFGDTRGHGSDWYTEISAVVVDFFAEFWAATQHGTPIGAA